jgi:hypothetical protein
MQWQQAMEKEQSSGVMLFDLSSAFDTLDHVILTRKLSSLNFSAHSVKWVTSFLEGRVQQVVHVVGRTLSPERNLDSHRVQPNIFSSHFTIYCSFMFFPEHFKVIKSHYCLVSLMWMKIGSNDITAQVPGVS